MPKFVVMDTETTGFVPKVHHVMEVAALASEDGKVSEEYESLLSLPEGAEIPEAVQMLTRIVPADLEGKPMFTDVQPELQKFCTEDSILVGQNWPFDLSMLRGEGWDLYEHPWIDTSMIASLVFPELPSYSLGYLSEALNLTHEPKHRALGDVRATHELLQACITRLEELPSDTMKKLQKISEKAPEGYKKFFAALEGKGKETPKWLQYEKKRRNMKELESLKLKAPDIGTVSLVEEPLQSDVIGRVLKGMERREWFAIKNMEYTLDRWNVPDDVEVLHEPSFIIDPAHQKEFENQKEYSADEIMLRTKLELYTPKTKLDLPLHGGERDIFSAKLACTPESNTWQELATQSASGSALISHRELLRMTRETPEMLPKNTHVIIDDASMLEDTITYAESWTCSIPKLRAAATGDPKLTKCADVIELWAEKTRSDQTIRYLAVSDLRSRESSHLIELLQELLKGSWSSFVETALSSMLKILDADNLSNRFAWIETMKDGSKIIQSVPESVSEVLQERIMSGSRLSLLVPRTGTALSAAFVDSSTPKVDVTHHWSPADLSLTFPIDANLDSVIDSIKGKTILLVGSRRMIEDIFVRHSETAEENGLTLICQGFSGGRGRMQAEFLEADGDALLVMTPWMYEGLELDAGSVNMLLLHSLPFDHPSHAVISRRALRYQNAFMQYSMPRLLNRLFRLLRTFVSHAAENASVMVLDDRIRTKKYGEGVKTYLESLVKGAPPKNGKEQMELL